MRYDGKMFHSQITQSTCIKRSRESKIEPTVNTRQGLLLPHQKVLAPSVLFQYPHGLMTILTAHKASSTGYILTNSDQNPLEPRTMQNHFKKVLKNSGITSANYHSLRHTFATRCIELGFDVKSLSEILGHASVNITMNRYVHPSMDLKRENMQRLSDLLAVK